MSRTSVFVQYSQFLSRIIFQPFKQWLSRSIPMGAIINISFLNTAFSTSSSLQSEYNRIHHPFQFPVIISKQNYVVSKKFFLKFCPILIANFENFQMLRLMRVMRTCLSLFCIFSFGTVRKNHVGIIRHKSGLPFTIISKNVYFK